MRQWGLWCVTVVLGACASAEASDEVPMLHIAASTFWMGCNSAKDSQCKADEKPQRKVNLSAFDIDVSETTVSQYKKCVSAGKCTLPASVQPFSGATYPGLGSHPVNFVTWDQARQYCQWRGAGFNLPSEAQWELAARGSCEHNGSKAGDAACADAMRTWPWGEATPTCALAVSSECNVLTPAAVGSKTGGDSPYGLHDMAGNVWEWTRDAYDLYVAGEQSNPSPTTGADDLRAARGGSLLENGTFVRGATRGSFPPSSAHAYTGMRCVKGP